MINTLRWMALLTIVGLLSAVAMLAKNKSREQRMLYVAAARTEHDNPSADFTKEAYLLTIRFRPGTPIAEEAQARIDIIENRQRNPNR